MTTKRILATAAGVPLLDLESTLSGSFHTPIGPSNADVTCGECAKALAVRSGAVLGDVTDGTTHGKRYVAHCLLCGTEIGQVLVFDVE